MNRKETTISTIAQAIVAINVILMSLGATNFGLDYDVVYPIVSLAVMVGAWGWGLWKNHNFTLSMGKATKL